MRAGAAGVHHALGNALVVEVGDLLAEVEVLHEGRPALAGLERIVGVRDAHALVGRQVLTLGACLKLVELLLFRETVVVGIVVLVIGASSPPSGGC